MEELRLDPQVFDLAKAAFACAVYLIGGLAAWRWIDRRPHACVPWGLVFALGTMAAMWTMTFGAALGALKVFFWVFFLAAAAILGFGLERFGVPRSSRSLSFVFPIKPSWVFPALMAALAWITALPAAGHIHLNYDVLSYHLPIAHHVAGDGGLGFLTGNYYSRLPLGAFVLEAPMLSNRVTTLDDPGVRVLIWAALVASGILAGRLAMQLGGRRPAFWMAAALISWHPMVWSGLLNAHTDLLTLMFGLAAAERLASGLARPRAGLAFALSGGFAGAAAAAKFSAVGIVFVPLLLITLLAARGHSGGRLKAIGFLLAGFAVIYGPWAVRALLISGSPLHPFVGNAPGWTEAQATFLLERHQPLRPWQVDYWVGVIQNLGLFGYVPYRGVPALLLPMAIVGMTHSPRGRGTLLFGVMAVLGYLAWATVGLAPSRFALPVVGLIAVVAALAPRALSRFPVAMPVTWGIAYLILLGTISTNWQSHYALPWRGELWQRGGGVSEEMLVAAHENAPGRVLLFFEARGRWFPPGNTSHTVWDVPTWAGDLKESGSALEFGDRLARRGFSHLFVNEFEFNRLLNFYGGVDLEWQNPAIRSLSLPREDAISLLGHYPPCQFADFTERDLGVLLDFLLLSRRRPVSSVYAAGEARQWLAPIPTSPGERTP